MESVVTDGGGKIEYLPGYRLGGKTGTAQKVIDGVYAQGKYICSFISVAPVDDPQIVVLAIVDEPTDVVAFGSTTAGPIIKEVMSQSSTERKSHRVCVLSLRKKQRHSVLPAEFD